MSQTLTPRQRDELAAQLQARLQELQRQLAEHHGGASRAEHAEQLLERDGGDEAPQRDAEREVDLALSDLDESEMQAVTFAMRRLDAGEHGRCVDCGEAIPWARLRLEPWALRCVDCEAATERRRGAPRPPTL